MAAALGGVLAVFALVCFGAAAVMGESAQGNQMRSLADTAPAYYLCARSFPQKPEGATAVLPAGQCAPCAGEPSETSCATFGGAWSAYHGGVPMVQTMKQCAKKWASKLNPMK